MATTTVVVTSYARASTPLSWIGDGVFPLRASKASTSVPTARYVISATGDASIPVHVRNLLLPPFPADDGWGGDGMNAVNLETRIG